MLRELMVALVTVPAVAIAAAYAQAESAKVGTFAGKSNHVVSGGVEVAQDENGFFVRFGEDFSFDGAPDPKIGFGNDDSFVEGTLIGPLQAPQGEQIYRVPDALDVADFTEVYIWCEQYSVPLGVAKIQ